jgi:hypothetical protein
MQQYATKKLEKPRTRQQVIRWVAEGKSDAWIASETGMQRSSVWRFRGRYQTQIDAYISKIETRLEDLAISRKAVRVADLDQMRTLLKSEVERGVAWEETTRHGTKRHLNAAVTELRATLKQAAEELDQLPRAGITVQNQNVVIVKHVEGAAELD